MTENKIKPTIEQVIYCLKAGSEKYPEVCEECQLYGEVGCDHCYNDTTDVAITLLKKYLKYIAIGTVEEFKTLKEKNEPKKPIRNDLCTCPSCGTYNETVKKRRNTVNMDIVYCWHCGQAMEIKRGVEHE